jgi:arylsulfate sulfotransferase
MRQLLESKALFVFLVLGVCTFMVACGGSSFNDPPGVASTSVTSTSNPLVAQVNVTSALGCSGQVMVEFGPDTTYGRNTSWVPAPAYLSTTSILVAGMRASTTYHMRATAGCSNAATLTGEDMTFTTGPLPALPFPTLTVTRPSPSASSPENPGIESIAIPTVVRAPALFTDRDANPIWFYDVGAGNLPYMFKLLPNGHMLVMILTSTSSTLREIDLAGNLIRELDIPTLDQRMQSAGFDFAPDNYSHDFAPLANGHVIVLTNFSRNVSNVTGFPNPTPVTGDGLIDLDENWNPVWAWNAFDYLSVDRHLNGLPDWTHGNAVVYSPEDGNLLLSLRHQSWILKIDYNNGAGAGDVIWELGYQGNPGFTLSADGFPTQDPSQWFSFQHFPSIVSQNGSQTTLAVWDNGDDRVLNTGGSICGAGSQVLCYSRATVFQLDESGMSADLAWTDVQIGYGLWGGSINQQSNGNVEFDLNAPAFLPTVASQVQEVTQTSTPQVVWQLDITPPTANAYRAYRVPSLYNDVTWQY